MGNRCDDLLDNIGIWIVGRQGGRLVTQNGEERLDKRDLDAVIIPFLYPIGFGICQRFAPVSQLIWHTCFDRSGVLGQRLDRVSGGLGPA